MPVSRATSLRERARAARASRNIAPRRDLDASSDSRAPSERDSTGAGLLVKRSEPHEHVTLVSGEDGHYAENHRVFIRDDELAFTAEKVLNDT